MIMKCSGTNSTNAILEAVHQDNMALAVAFQAEKEKVRQAYAVNLQLKKEQEDLFLQLLLLNNKVQDQEEMSANSTNTVLEAVYQDHKALAVALQAEKENVRQATAVILQLKREQQAQSLHLLELLNEKLQKQEAMSANSSENKSNNLTKPLSLMDSQRKKNNNENVFETPSQKGSSLCADHYPSKEQEHEGMLATYRSSSRPDCVQELKTTNEGSVTCLKTFTASPICSDEANQKQMHQDVEPVLEEPVEVFEHSTPEPAPAKITKQNEPVPAIRKVTRLKKQVSVTIFLSKDSLSVSSSESEDNRNIPSEKQFTVFRDEESSPKVERSKKEEIPEWKSHEQERDGEENQTDPHEADIEEKCLLPVTPVVEAEKKRIDNILFNIVDSSDYNSPLTDQTPQSVKSCKKGGLGLKPTGRGLSLGHVTNLFRKFSRGGSRPSDACCSTPALAPTGKRSCTTTVDYKEPSMNTKRGDKCTVLEFLRSVFRPKSGRRSVQKS